MYNLKQKGDFTIMNIELPNPENSYSFLVADDYVKIPRIGGVYLFYSENNTILYVGKTNDLGLRINGHLSGRSGNTKCFKHLFHKATMYFIESEADRDIYETYFINKLSPLFNISKTFEYESIGQILDSIEFEEKSLDQIIQLAESKSRTKLVEVKTSHQNAIILRKEIESTLVTLDALEAAELIYKILCTYKVSYGGEFEGRISKSSCYYELKRRGYAVNTLDDEELIKELDVLGIEMNYASVKWKDATPEQLADFVLKYNRIRKKDLSSICIQNRLICPKLRYVKDDLSKLGIHITTQHLEVV
jgi:hypothetical protein